MVIVGRVGEIIREAGPHKEHTVIEICAMNDSLWAFCDPQLAQSLHIGDGVIARVKLEESEGRLFYQGIDFQSLPLAWLQDRRLL